MSGRVSTNPILNGCPVCAGMLTVTRLHCPRCDTAVEGRFAPGPFATLGAEQLAFVELFVRCEGKLKSMEAELGLSYPTVRARLHDVIRALGYEPAGREDPGAGQAEERRRVLRDLESGLIDTAEAMARLQRST